MNKVKSWVVVGIIGFIVLMLGASTIGTYNGLASSKNSVDKAWSDVETTYQRRADLIPNLVAVAEQASIREEGILEGVIQARANAVNAPADDINAVESTQGELTSALNRLMVVSEDYPELQSNQNWIDLQAQIEGTENRINTARRDYNEIAQSYNDKLVRFPTNVLAGAFGFEKAEFFKSDPGSEDAPTITFDNESD